ncbi:MAG: PHP domain-containing protein [Thermoanaerobacteraceae bacterium]|nr:PHP domain-containing protein [Thermoanaerobacteraceae bacterium]
MKLYYDLHIHTALSPCADNSMTPNNIINMAHLKGLDIIAITDHNSGLNLPPFFEIAPRDLIIIPGMEVQSSEEVHLLCYFKKLDDAMKFNEIIEGHLPSVPSSPYFGEQLILDSNDNIIGTYDKLLLNSVDLSVNEIYKIIINNGGAVVPAHIDRPHFSLISNLGIVPEGMHFKSVELTEHDSESFYKKFFYEIRGFYFHRMLIPSVK